MLVHTRRPAGFSGRTFALALCVLLSACATAPPSDTVVRERAQAHWNALLAGDFDSAYGYLSPGYRSSHSRVDFEIGVRSRKVRWESAEVQEASCEADVCMVTTLVGYKVRGAVPGVSSWSNRKDVQEKWIRTDGQWWLLPDK